MGKKHRTIKTCQATGKRIYTDRDSLATTRAGVPGLNARYICTACGGWHLTRKGHGNKGEIRPPQAYRSFYRKKDDD